MLRNLDTIMTTIIFVYGLPPSLTYFFPWFFSIFYGKSEHLEVWNNKEKVRNSHNISCKEYVISRNSSSTFVKKIFEWQMRVAVMKFFQRFVYLSASNWLNNVALLNAPSSDSFYNHFKWTCKLPSNNSKVCMNVHLGRHLRFSLFDPLHETNITTWCLFEPFNP